MPAPPHRLGEFVATLALAQDNAIGQPLQSQLRSSLLATWMGDGALCVRQQALHRGYLHPHHAVIGRRPAAGGLAR